MRVLTEDMLAEASQRHKNGESWNSIAKHLGLSPYVIRLRLDPEFAKRAKLTHHKPTDRAIADTRPAEIVNDTLLELLQRGNR